MRIAVTGSSGLIGTALIPVLRAGGHTVVRLVRRAATAPDEITWDPHAGTVDVAALQGTDAIVHLAGAGVGDHRWTASYKRKILDSRVRGTDTIARAMTELDPSPGLLLCASAIGYYGETGDRVVDETSGPGQGFLADVVVRWEAAADPAREAGIRVAHARNGIVVAREGGAFGRLLPLFRLGLGGRLASGRQWWSYVSLPDLCAAYGWLLGHDVDGPVNVTAPQPATNAEVTAALARVLHRPAALPVPGLAIRALLGEFSVEVLGSKRVRPGVLTDRGFTFAHPSIDDAVALLT